MGCCSEWLELDAQAAHSRAAEAEAARESARRDDYNNGGCTIL